MNPAGLFGTSSDGGPPPGWRLVLEEYLLEHEVLRAGQVREFLESLNDRELKLLFDGMHSQKHWVLAGWEYDQAQILLEGINDEWDRRHNQGLNDMHTLEVIKDDYEKQRKLSCMCGWRTTFSEEFLARSAATADTYIQAAWRSHLREVAEAKADEVPPF